jgi:acetyltransferase
MLQPASVAVINDGSSSSSSAPVVVRNLQSSGFKGEIFSVWPKGERIEGIPCYRDIAELPKAPELAVIVAEPKSLPGLITRLGALGTKAVLIIDRGYACAAGEPDQGIHAAMLAAAKPYLLRITGPDSFGVSNPTAGLNASLSKVKPLRGNIAFVSRSGSVTSAVVEWATSRGIGFSHVISLGRTIDVDYGDMLDYLARDSSAEAVLLHIESITHARKFMSAARLVARLRPVIVLKGRRYTGQTGNCRASDGAGPLIDDVYDAAFRRAGMLGVHTIEELFGAFETLGIARSSPLAGDHLAILSNGGGMGALAADALTDEGGRLAELSPDSIAKLDDLLQSAWSRSNPVAVPLDTPATCYAGTVGLLLDDKGIDSVLAVHCPNAAVTGADTARAVVDTLKKRSGEKPLRLLASWLGEESAGEASKVFSQAGIPSYATPNDAVRGFMQLVRYRRNQELLMQTPPTVPEAFEPDADKAREIISRAMAEGREWLSDAEVEGALGAYHIPFGSPSDVLYEVFVGMEVEDQFGPVIRFGLGGSIAEAIHDRACGMPPLNMHLAGELMSRARIGRHLRRCCGSEVGGDDLALMLVKVSQLVCDMDQIVEIRLDPLIIGSKGIGAAGAGIRIAGPGDRARRQLAIRPYPRELEETISLPDGHAMLLRPVLPEDEPAYNRLFQSLSLEEVFMRFMSALRVLPRNLAVRLTQIDYDREMALVLVGKNERGETELYGGARIIADADNELAEFAILLRGDMVGMGLGPMLMRRIIDYARGRGIREIFGEVLTENRPMLKLCQALGFKVKWMPDDPGVKRVSLDLIG